MPENILFTQYFKISMIFFSRLTRRAQELAPRGNLQILYILECVSMSSEHHSFALRNAG